MNDQTKKSILQRLKDRMPRLTLKKKRSPDKIKTDGETRININDHADNWMVPESEKDLAEAKITIPWYHFYKRPGFKRITGLAVGVSGLVLRFFPEYQLLGEVVIAAGGSLGIFGYGHSLKKNLEKDQNTYVDRIKMFKKIAEVIIQIVKVIMPLFSKLTKKGDSK